MVLFSAVWWSGFGMLGNAGAQFAGFLYLFHGVGQIVPKQKFCDGNFVRTEPWVAPLKWWPNARPSKEGELIAVLWNRLLDFFPVSDLACAPLSAKQSLRAVHQC